jgi:predicted HicB family RNase H-like nuclease
MKPMTLRYGHHVAAIDVDAESRLLHGRVLGMRDVLDFHGETVAELEAAFHETVDDYIAWCRSEGEEPQKTWSGKMTFRPDDELRNRIALAAALAGKSINSWMADTLEKAAKDAVEKV